MNNKQEIEMCRYIAGNFSFLWLLLFPSKTMYLILPFTSFDSCITLLRNNFFVNKEIQKTVLTIYFK